MTGMNNDRGGDFAVRGARFAIVVGRFNSSICEHLLEGALETIVRNGGDRAQIEVVRVPGAFEIPLALKQLAASKKFDGLVALGCVIRGDTPHFDYVCNEASRGIAQVGLEFGIPIGFGLLTVDTVEQAQARAGSGTDDNKGVDAALAAIEMVNLMKKLRG
jgi:6,7-dimethyl-8-ribityllumazine synthase